MKVLVTGGFGYIGSHTVVELLNRNYEVIIVDNLVNSSIEVVDSIKKITNRDFSYYIGDVCDKEFLRNIFNENNIDAVLHFAGLKSVGESNSIPLRYYENNIGSTLNLCGVMREFNVKKIVFSSSATVYGKQEVFPIEEDAKLTTTNPYGSSKLFIEYILDDLYKSDNEWGIIKLRYFNPVGAHESGLIGENPNGIPNNLVPYVDRVALGELSHLNIFGNDYDTKDGTGVRDFIHIMDLAIGHIKALEYLENNKCCEAINLGTGHGYSVLEIVEAYEMVNNVKIPYCFSPRREGDIATCYADNSKAKELLNWEPTLGLDDMVKSSYNYVLRRKK